MKTSRFLNKRLAAAAFLAVLATTALAQGPDGQGGPPPGGPQDGPGGRRMGRPPALDRLPPLVSLINRPGVAEELALTDGQMERIDEIARSLGGRMGPPPGGPGGGPDGDRPPQGGPPRGDRAARDKAEADADAKIKAILTAAQAKRLDEIQIQTMGLTAAMVPAVQAKLGLSDDQKSRLKALAPPRPEGGRGGGPQGGFGGPPPDEQGGPPPDGRGGPGGGRGPGGMRNDPRRREIEAKIAAVLTADQKATLKALGGKELPRPDDNRPPEG